MDYNLGRGRGGQGPQKFEDLDEETRAKIAKTFVEIARQHQSLVESFESGTEAVRTSLSALVDATKFLAQVVEKLRWFVPNWPDDLDIARAWSVADEGIPVAFVPRPALVAGLVDADTIDERRNLLARSKGAILADCRQALIPAWDAPLPVPESVAMLSPLLFAAIDALEDRHAAAACALGACIVDSLIRRTEGDLSYPTLRKRAQQATTDTAAALNQLRVELAWRPIHSLLTKWNPKSALPQPTMPSRHVVAHWASPEHLSEENAIIVVMAATSLFLGLCESEQRKELIERS